MKDQVPDLLRGHDADYVEAHLEERESTHITYRNGCLEEVNRSYSSGGNARALVRGGWGFVTFDGSQDLRDKVALVVREARLAGTGPLRLPESEAAAATVAVRVERDATTLPLEQKKALLDQYSDIMMSTGRTRNARIDYRDSKRRTIFASSEGHYIEQSMPDLSLRLTAIARQDSEVQQSGLSLGSNGEFSAIEGLHDKVRDLAERASALLSAGQVKGGEYTVIVDPVLAGVFAHEAFGHLSESDFVYQNDRLRELMTLGRRFGGHQLNIVDDPTWSGLRGSYRYDDEGTRASRTYLIREGILTGRLHSRQTAAKMGERTTGNARAISYRYPPIVRMSNTYIENGDATFDDMIADVREGVYVKNWYGGMTSLEMFTFSAGEAYMIRDGRIAEMLKPVVLSGNVFVTLQNIDAVGNDLEMNQGGGCGKGGQSPLPVSNGSPHLRIRNCLVGGA
ncbi:MAG: TldD/PmbA family protein [Chloroflexota bacterium]